VPSLYFLFAVFQNEQTIFPCNYHNSGNYPWSCLLSKNRTCQRLESVPSSFYWAHLKAETESSLQNVMFLNKRQEDE
jgi:hypothetical protein